MDTILHDVRYSVRLLRRYRGSSLVAIATLAVAIGISTALFTVIDAALLRPLPYPHPEELVDITISVTGPRTSNGLAPSIDDVRAMRASGILTHAGMGRVAGFMAKIVDAGKPERLTVGSATEDFLETYGVVPVIGRLITIDDTRDGAPAVALLGHAYWRRQFGADPQVLGQSLRIENSPVTIVGVLPPGFYRQTDLWEVTPASRLRRDGSGTPAVGRMRAGLSPDSAASQLTPVLPAGTNPSVTRSVRVRSLYQEETAGFGSTIATLGYAVGLIVVIACVNVAGLLFARGAVRRPELTIRAAIGASRARLVRQQIVESLVTAVGAGIIGVALAWLTLDALVALIPLALPENAPPTINLQALAFALGLSVTTALVFGVVPALRLSRASVATRLAFANRRHGSALTRQTSRLLIGAEVALAIVLLAGAGLLVRSFAKVMSAGVGYDPEHLVTMEVQPLAPEPAFNATFYPALIDAIRRLPEVAAAGAIDDLTIRGGTRFSSLTTAKGVDIGSVQRQILPGYFEALGLQAVQGRLPVSADLTGSESALLLNERALKKYFPNESPLGLTLDGPQLQNGSRLTGRVIGVVPDVKFSGPQSGANEEFYIVPLASRMDLFGLAIRFRPGQSVPINRLRATAEATHPNVFVGKVTPASATIGDRVASRRHRMLLLGLLGALGLALALVGILTMTAYGVAERTQEVGVRMAFGAEPGRIVFEILRDTSWPIAIGLAAGLGAAFYATRVLEKFLFQTTARDVVTFVATAILMAITAGIAAWLPARRAARVDPVRALRAD